MRTPVLVPVLAAAILTAAPAAAQVEGERVEDPYAAARRALSETYEDPAGATGESTDQAGLGNDRFDRSDERDAPSAAIPEPRPKPAREGRPPAAAAAKESRQRPAAADAYQREREKAQLAYWQERAELAREYDRAARQGNADRAAREYRERRRELEARLGARTLDLDRRYGRSGG